MATADKVSRDGLYPLGDRPRKLPKGVVWNSWGNGPKGGPMARWTGEKRPPKAGEWYLSGAIVTAYRAPNDLDTPYCIATLVLAKRRESFDVSPWTEGE